MMDNRNSDNDSNVDNEDENIQLNDEDIDQVIELDGVQPDDHYASDDEDLQSTSNMSGIDDREIVDDSACSLQAHEQDCFSVAMIADRWLATGGEDDAAYLWDQSVSESDPVLKIPHNDSVTKVAFNFSNTLLATADMSGKIIVTQLSDLKTRAEMEEANDLEWMLWHHSSDIIFGGDSDGMVWMWLIGSNGVAQSKVFSATGAVCTAGHLLPDGKRLLAGYTNGSLRLWSLRDQSSQLLYFHSPITTIDHHQTLPLGAVGTQSGTVNIINTSPEGDVKKVAMLTPLSAVTKTVNEEGEEEEDVNQCVECVSISKSHPWMAVGRNDGSLCVYELDSSSPRSIFRTTEAQAINCAAWSLDGITPYLIVGSVDGKLRIFDARDGSLYKELGNGGDEILDLTVLSASPLRVMTAGGGGVVRIFEPSRVA